MSKTRDKMVFVRIAERFERKGYKVKILCTDGYEGYGYYKLADRHVVSKSETCLVESVNSLIRNYLTRFYRRTKRYSKALDMIFHSLVIFFNNRGMLWSSILI